MIKFRIVAGPDRHDLVSSMFDNKNVPFEVRLPDAKEGTEDKRLYRISSITIVPATDGMEMHLQGQRVLDKTQFFAHYNIDPDVKHGRGIMELFVEEGFVSPPTA